jgi:hypothetical protein
MRTLGVGILAAALSAVSAPRAHAQFTFGVKGGMSSAKLFGDAIDEADWRNGFVGGGFASYRFGNVFAIQPEVLFAQKGTAVNTLDGAAINGKLRINYIEIPLLAKLLLPLANNANLRPFLMAGPSLAFKTYCEAEGTFEGVSIVAECADPLFEEELGVKAIDWNLIFGGGFGVPIGGATLVLDARYQFGLRTIDDSTISEEVKNQSVYVMAGISIPLGRPIVAALR